MDRKTIYVLGAIIIAYTETDTHSLQLQILQKGGGCG